MGVIPKTGEQAGGFQPAQLHQEKGTMALWIQTAWVGRQAGMSGYG
jgi:hypothetical protein